MALVERWDAEDDGAVHAGALSTAFGPVRYADALPGPVEVAVAGPTGLLALEDDPRRIGWVQGLLAGMSFPSACGTGEAFLAQYGPDAELTGEAQTAVVARDRVHWIEGALPKSLDPQDRDRVTSALGEARGLAERARQSAEVVRGEHARWRTAFLKTSEPVRRGSRASMLFVGALLGYALGSGPVTMVAWGLAAILCLGLTGRIAFRRRFDRDRATDIKLAIYGERFRSTALRVLEMQRRGLLSA